jgi:hypothetical protein
MQELAGNLLYTFSQEVIVGGSADESSEASFDTFEHDYQINEINVVLEKDP